MNRAAPRASNAAKSDLTMTPPLRSQNVGACNSATCFNSGVGTAAVSTIAIGRRVARQVGPARPGGARDDGKRIHTTWGGGPPTFSTAQAGAQAGALAPGGTAGPLSTDGQ